MENFLEITYHIDIVKEEKNGKDKIIKRNLPVKKLVAINDIKNPTQLFSEKGLLIKNKCRIFVKDEGDLVINKSYEYIKNLLTTQIPEYKPIIGFNLKTNKK